MKKTFIALAALLLLALPWWVVSMLQKKTTLSLYCQVPYVINSNKEDSMLLKGSIKTHYYPNSKGIGILTGTMQFRAKGSDEIKNYTISRNTSYTYHLMDSYIITKTNEMHLGYGDNLPPTLEGEFLFPIFKKDYNDYFQFQRMANNDIMVSVASMPRLYCHAPE